MANQFEQPQGDKIQESKESKEKMTYLGQAVFGFDSKLNPIIKWFETENPILGENDILILKNAGQKEEILKITIGRDREISTPLELSGLGKTLILDPSDPKDIKKKFIFDVYRAEKTGKKQ